MAKEKKSSKLMGCLFIILLIPVLGIIASMGGGSGNNSTVSTVSSSPATPAESVPELTPEEKAAATKKERIEDQFSGWDGSHYNLVKLVKLSMNDPNSFEHVSTNYWDRGDYITVQMTYRGKNLFGGVVTETAKVDFDLDGRVHDANAAPPEPTVDPAVAAEEARIAAEMAAKKKSELNARQAIDVIEKNLIGKDNEQAKEKLQRVIERYPETDAAQKASELLDSLE